MQNKPGLALVATTDQPADDRCCGSCNWWYPVAATQTALALEGLCGSAQSNREQTEHDDVCQHWDALEASQGPNFGVIGLRSIAWSLGHGRRVPERDHLDNSADGMRREKHSADG
jgi:hypothetical protein